MTGEQWGRLVRILRVADVTEDCVVAFYFGDEDRDFRRRMYRVRKEAWAIYRHPNT
jgi:hypothetical protein